MRWLVLFFIAHLASLERNFAADPAHPANPGHPVAPRIDLNNAAKETIETLPGVGPKLAQAIIEGRPYRVIDDLDRVKGIGPAKLEQIRSHVFIVPMRTTNEYPVVKLPAPAAVKAPRVNINKATQQELEKLPGIGPGRAKAIIAARPFQKPEDVQRIPNLKGAAYGRIKDLITVAP